MRLVLPFVLLGLAYATVMQNVGWAQGSYLALVKSLVHEGTPRVDSYHWESRDVSYYEGHYYSVKAPGLPALTAPLYAGLDAIGAPGLAADVAATANRHGNSRWHYEELPVGNYGFDPDRRDRVQVTLEKQSPLLWPLNLLGVVLPAMLLLVIVRRCAERLEPGYGTAAAVTLGAATLVLPFATQFFGHLLAAVLAFGAFAVLMRERAGPARVGLVALAGVLAGLAVTTEYPLAFAGAVVGVYAMSRGDLLRRGAAYAAGAVAGTIPLLAYNLWAFGSLTHLSYEGAVARAGHTGHAVLGLNDGGFFGITLPEPSTALELLFSARGLLTLTPVVGVALYGLVLVYRRGHRAEALTALAVAAVYLVWNSGYWTPFGGGSPGPRFLIPMLPFAALGLAAAWRERPAITAALAAPSTVMMLTGTLTRPLIGDNDSIGDWVGFVADGLFSNTLLSAVGLGNGWFAMAPVVVLVVAAVVLGRPSVRSASVQLERPAAMWLAAWAGLACSTPALWGKDAAITGDSGSLVLILMALAAGAVAIFVTADRVPEPEPASSAGHQRVDHDLATELTV